MASHVQSLGSTLRLSRFNLYVDDFPSAGSTLVYNSLTGAFLEIPTTTRVELERLDRGEVTTDEVEVDPEWLDDDAQFLVESYDDDERAFDEWYEGMRSRPDTLDCIVSVTFACNLDCSYCCQADVMDGKTMTAATGQATASWLASRAVEIGAKTLHITFVGGEPLLQKGRIEEIVGTLRTTLGFYGIELQFTLITNGVFLTRKLVEKWLPLGLRGAQVTLDGDETTHSITRRSKKNAPDSYPTIFRNVVECASLIKINVNGNYQPETIGGFPGLIAKLRAAGLPKGTSVHFSPALTALGAPTDSAAGSCTMGAAHPEWMLGLRDQIVKAGFKAGDGLAIGPCAFHLKHSFAVDPLGNIYKCPGFLGKPEWAIGKVSTGLTSAYDRIVESRPHRACGSCSHRPDCAGGCIAAEWVAKGKEEGINCEHEFYERAGDDLLKRKYAFLVAAQDGSDPFDLIPAVEVAALDHPDSHAGRGGHRSSALRVLAS